MVDPFAKWKQQGSVYFWRFEPQKSGLAGWHFAADSAGKESIIELLDALTKSDFPTKRTVKLTEPPTRVADMPFSPRPGRKIVSPSALRLVFQPEWHENAWQVRADCEHVELTLGRSSIRELAQAVVRAKSGEFDFSVGPSKDDPPQNIWFW